MESKSFNLKLLSLNHLLNGLKNLYLKKYIKKIIF